MSKALEVSKSLDEAGFQVRESAKISNVKVVVPSFTFTADFLLDHDVESHASKTPSDRIEMDTFNNNVEEMLQKIIPSAIAHALAAHSVEVKKGGVKFAGSVAGMPSPIYYIDKE